ADSLTDPILQKGATVPTCEVERARRGTGAVTLETSNPAGKLIIYHHRTARRPRQNLSNLLRCTVLDQASGRLCGRRPWVLLGSFGLLPSRIELLPNSPLMLIDLVKRFGHLLNNWGFHCGRLAD